MTRAAPARPRAIISPRAVQTRSGISPSSPRPSRSATSLVNARPRPRSNRLKYPRTIQARVSTPNRSVPRPRISTGMVITATARGATWLRRFQIAFRPSRRPCVNTVAASPRPGG